MDERSMIMKVAVSSTGKGLDAVIDPRFGRCACFVIVDTDDMSCVCHDNESAALGGGAGIQAAQFVISKGAQAVLTGSCGPNAISVFSAAGVMVVPGQRGTVREAVEKFQTGGFQDGSGPVPMETLGKSTTAGQVPGTSAWLGRCRGGTGRGRGMGQGMGIGMGRGMGSRQGGGRGMGRWLAGPRGGMEPPVSAGETAESLKKQVEELQRQLQTIQETINRIP